MVDAFGAVNWWGFSPALDLQQKRIQIDSDSSSDLNILIVGAGDCRHILKTIAYTKRHQTQHVNFYIIESSLELLCRHLFFLTLALEPPKAMGLQEKTELFLEVFGNSLIRQQTKDYIMSKTVDFIRLVTDSDFLHEKLPVVDLSSLKFKERDRLEAIFKFWRSNNDDSFNISQHWDNRLRRYLATRYDSRTGCYDWDYNMKMLDRDAGIIHKKEYSYWRDTGSAFSIREGTYDVPNRTLASALVVNKPGENITQLGYWGDIVCSPYLAFGIECEEPILMKKSNNSYTKTAQDISEYNILAMLHELTTGERYQLSQSEGEKQPKEAETLTEITEEEEDENNLQESCQENVNQEPSSDRNEYMKIENVSIIFLPLGSACELHKKGKYKKLFDIVYIGNSMVHHLKEELSATFADQATLITETAQFMLELNKEQCQEFTAKVRGLATAIGCQVASSSEGLKDSFLRFKFERKT